MILQAIHDISEICSKKGIRYALLSPGSRCAPLTISFARNDAIKSLTFSDERSAAFHALGIAGYEQKPVVLVCTSGSAAFNYAPAVAEAFYQQIPLLILTADRPPEWIDQFDGQTINQTNIYGTHVKKSFTVPDNLEEKDAYWHTNRILNEAINLSEQSPKGPVHVNIPLREPFYPTEGEILNFSDNVRVINNFDAYSSLQLQFYTKKIESYSKVLLVPGQQPYNGKLIDALDRFIDKTKCTIITDIISNLQEVKGAIKHHDLFIDNFKKLPESFKPELLITFGKSLISKNLKIYLRSNPAVEHWHVQPYAHPVVDTFQGLTEVIQTNPLDFFSHAALESYDSTDFNEQKKQNYSHAWSIVDSRVGEYLQREFKKNTFSEFCCIGKCINQLPEKSVLHLSNSMTVRYANFAGLSDKREIEVFANRGTSGIDGSNSTAFGNALITDKIVTLITGDLAFFYDRNSFWNNYHPANLRIILINNYGGGIFRMIDGPKNLEELEKYFVTEQKQTAVHLAAEFGFQHAIANNSMELERILNLFFAKSTHPKILELKTDSKLSASYLKEIKKIVSD